MSKIESIFKLLDGKKAYVQANGCRIEGGMEQFVTLKYIPNWGLRCLKTLEYNGNIDIINQKIDEIIKEKNLEKNSDIYYTIKNFLNKVEIQLGFIYESTIKSFTVKLYKDEISVVVIEYEDCLVKIIITT